MERGAQLQDRVYIICHCARVYIWLFSLACCFAALTHLLFSPHTDEKSNGFDQMERLIYYFSYINMQIHPLKQCRFKIVPIVTIRLHTIIFVNFLLFRWSRIKQFGHFASCTDHLRVGTFGRRIHTGYVRPDRATFGFVSDRSQRTPGYWSPDLLVFCQLNEVAPW